MFVVSKVFWITAQPLSLAFLCLCLGLFLAFIRWRRLGMLFSAVAVLILFVMLYTSTGVVQLQRLEARFPQPTSDPAEVSCMIVLGGAFETSVNTYRRGMEFSEASERFIEALRLARAFPQSRILVSGGDGSLSGVYEGDAVTSERFFTTFGIASDRIIRETTSRTTYENTVNTKQVLAGTGLNNCLLITSAFHMPRSIGLFRKAGIAVTPWPVDYRTTGIETLRFDFTQPTLNTQLTSLALRESIGLLTYYLMGRTDSLYPAP